MKHDIIKTDNYLLVVDKSEIKEGDWIYDEDNGVVKIEHKYQLSNINVFRKDCKKIISHLPLNGSPILEGVDLLPPLEEDDAEKKARELTNHLTFPEERKEGIIIGYNKAKEKYKYTEEDLRKAWNAAYIDAMSIDEETYKPLFFEDFIQSLSQPKMPIGFECVMEKDFKYNDDGEPFGFKVHNSDKITTTTTPKGHTQWVGTYIYE